MNKTGATKYCRPLKANAAGIRFDFYAPLAHKSAALRPICTLSAFLYFCAVHARAKMNFNFFALVGELCEAFSHICSFYLHSEKSAPLF